MAVYSQGQLQYHVLSKWYIWQVALEACLEDQNNSRLQTHLPQLDCFKWSISNTGKSQYRKNCHCQLMLHVPIGSASVNHLLLPSPFAAVSGVFFCLFSGYSAVIPHSTKDVFSSWTFWRVDKSIKKIWRMIPAVTFGTCRMRGTAGDLMGFQLQLTHWNLDV